MTTPKTTTWKADPHTLVKHAILRRYLGAWLPIMASWNGRIVFIDGFAGPGRYEGGEPGSPIIALKCLLEHPHFKTRSPRRGVTMLFIEKKKDRTDHLQVEIDAMRTAGAFPEWLTVDVVCGDFSVEMGRLLDGLEADKATLAPTFAFVDPFGFSGVALDVIARIVKNDKCECLITFMYESINRFLSHPTADIQAHFDQLFGTDTWRELLGLEEPIVRRDSIVDLYRKQLQAAGLRYVRTFEMINEGNRTEYFLYFGTNNLTGLSKMKQAMWAEDPVRGSLFSDRTDPRQAILLAPGADTLPLRNELLTKFRGEHQVLIETVEAFVLVDTAFSEYIHLKRATLAPMEKAIPPLLKAIRPATSSDRKGTFPPGTTIQFL